VKGEKTNRSRSRARLERSRSKREPGSAFIAPTCQTLERGFENAKSVSGFSPLCIDTKNNGPQERGPL